MGKVFEVEEMNHPVAALVAALQQEEFTPLLVVQLNNVERGCGGTEISETDGKKHIIGRYLNQLDGLQFLLPRLLLQWETNECRLCSKHPLLPL